MEKKKSLVSIIVPAYNAEKFIDKCIRSVLNQSYPNLELILVDDGSTDETGKICEEYASKDTRVRVIHKKNSGVSAARNMGPRNMGLSSAIGEYVVFLDSDDWLDEDIVELALKKYQKNCINIWGFVCYWPRNVLKTEELRAEGLCQEELIANAIFTRSTAHYDLGNYFRTRMVSTFPMPEESFTWVGKVAPPMPTMPASRMMPVSASALRPRRLERGCTSGERVS